MRRVLPGVASIVRRALLASGIATGVAAAQAPAPPAGPPTPAPSTGPQAGAANLANCPTSGAAARITDAYRLEAERAVPPGTPRPAASRKVKLRDVVAVRVENLQTLADELACAERDGQTRSVVLYLDDRPLPDLKAYPPTDPKAGVLLFTLRRTEASRDVWTHLLGKPGLSARPTKASIGIDDRFAIPSTAYLDLHVLPRFWLTFWGLLFGLLILIFFSLAKQSGLLRDTAASPTGDKRTPYSLARVQAACWFFVVLAAYLFIGLITGDFSTSITGTVLVLLGLSGVTTVAAAAVDASKDTTAEETRARAALQTLDTEIAKLENDHATAQAAITATPPDPTKLDDLSRIETELEVKRSQLRKVKNESERFDKDILSDANGISFHRFQMATWTLVLGLVFCVQVYRDLAMPEFSQTLLALMGISAGTFVSLKVTEPVVPKRV